MRTLLEFFIGTSICSLVRNTDTHFQIFVRTHLSLSLQLRLKSSNLQSRSQRKPNFCCHQLFFFPDEHKISYLLRRSLYSPRKLPALFHLTFPFSLSSQEALHLPAGYIHTQIRSLQVPGAKILYFEWWTEVLHRPIAKF